MAALPLHVHDTGDGPALLLLHAFPLDASQWDAQVAALSDRYRCLRPDAPGCGASPPPEMPEGVTVDDLGARVLAELDGRGVDRFAVVGLSMGGYVAMALLRLAPERVAALVLADTRATADDEAGRRRRFDMVERVRADGVDAIVESTVQTLIAPRSAADFHISDPVRGRIRRCTAAGITACQHAMAERPDSTAELRTATMPALVLVGDEDAVTPPQDARAMAAAIPQSRLEVIEGAGHLSNLEQPQRFTALLGGFLDEVLSPSE